LDLGFRIWGLGFRVWNLGFRVWGSGFREQGQGFRVWIIFLVLGFMVHGLVFRV